jgi:3-hydroxy-3-methylglutaryl CoA synthase/uncharacterized OB-fold protein
MTRGILSFGAYIPALRIDRAAIAAANAWAFPSVRGKGARALANWDEDTVTMSVEAARGASLTGIGGVIFASTTPPYADLQNATLVTSALGLPVETATTDTSGSLRAGTSALLAALHTSEPANTLVVAADARHAKPGSAQELTYGAGAVAFCIGDGPVIAKLLGAATRAEQFVDHYRQAGEKYDYYWEERWVRDEGYAKIIPPAIKTALEKAGVKAADIAHFILPALQAAVPAAIAKKCGIPAESITDNLQANCGDTGAAHGLLMLAAALEKAKPGDKLVLVTFGAGTDVLVFEATEALADYHSARPVAAALAAGRVEPHYTKLLSFHGELSLDWGMRSEGSEKIALTQQYRARGQLATFNGGKCPDCGAINFPQLASCVNCGSFAPLEQISLVDEAAQVASYTADWLQYSPAPPLYFGLVQFDNGCRVMSAPACAWSTASRASIRSGTTPAISGKPPPFKELRLWPRASRTKSRSSAWAAPSSASAGTWGPSIFLSKPSAKRWKTPASKSSRSRPPGTAPAWMR